MYFTFLDLINTKGKRRKRTWIITGVVVVVGIGIAVAAIVLITTRSGDAEDTDTPSLNLEDFLNGKFSPKTFNGTWTSAILNALF
ncbi:hypothetical protein NQ318_020206 [Aromia moschata]|uniref:Uncharacterized protein n=1 Tax=Aromia moschata TaxID=1265417 RepID=A0AAV8Z9D1_9CUCU|nr:hypothetical protein NQ318_020206 [Aromia moschata]